MDETTKTIHNSSLTTDQRTQKISLEEAITLIRDFKTPGNVERAITLIQGVVNKSNNI